MQCTISEKKNARYIQCICADICLYVASYGKFLVERYVYPSVLGYEHTIIIILYVRM